MTKVMITGAAGYIGTHLEKYLNDHTDWEIETLDRNWHSERSKEIMYTMDLANDKAYPSLKRVIQEQDIIFHLAAVTPKNPLADYWKSNVGATWKILSAMKAMQKLVYTSTLAVKRDWEHPYAWSKKATEKIIEAFHHPIATVRLANVWGRRSHSVIDTWIWKMIMGKDIEIHNGQSRDFVHVFDVCNALLHIGKYMLGRGDWYRRETFEVGTGVTCEIDVIARLLKDCMGTESKLNYIDKEYSASKVDLKELRNIGWKPSMFVNVPTLGSEYNWYKELIEND